MTNTTRVGEVDFIRMVALLGICIVNVPFMALPPELTITPPVSLYDKLLTFLVACFFQMKFFLLFSFVFGWGMGVQEYPAKRRAQSTKVRTHRRLGGLVLFGVAHAVFVFTGDILVLMG